MARARKHLDLQAVAEALTDPRNERVDMETIAARLGVAKPTLYRMAGGRDDLIALSIDAEAERLLAAIHSRGPAGFFEFAEQAPAGFLVLFGGRYPEAHKAIRRIELMLVRRLGGAGPDAAVAATAFLGAAAALTSRALAAGRPVKAERLRSDFDAAAKFAVGISDTGSMVPDPSAT